MVEALRVETEMIEKLLLHIPGYELMRLETSLFKYNVYDSFGSFILSESKVIVLIVLIFLV